MFKPALSQTNSAAKTPLVKVERLTKKFPVAADLFRAPTNFTHAVDDVSFSVGMGEVLGLIGESGCGKTTTGKLLVKLETPTSGQIFIKTTHLEAPWPSDRSAIAQNTQITETNQFVDIAHLRSTKLKFFRRNVQMIFQDPYESLNPRMTIYDICAEPLAVQKIGSLLEREERVTELLALVGLTPPETFLFRYPHELSGGQRQRVAIARAMILNPSFIVADEPTSMLDVSIRTGVMNLMLELREKFDISFLYITHDLAVARYMCDRIAVMYLGKIVEMGATEDVIQNPQHPYTKALISAVPIPDPAIQRQAMELKGGVTKPINPAPRCRFYERCPIATPSCANSDHPLLEDKGNGHQVACYEV
jgi:peptide/nickel transport system ATP-binding protein